MLILKASNLKSKREMLEMAFDLKIFGDALDRVGTPDKRLLLPAMKRCYEALGSRFQHIEVQKETGDIRWDVCGPWVLSLVAIGCSDSSGIRPGSTSGSYRMGYA